MRAPLHPDAYRQPEALTAERIGIFRRSFNLVAFAEELEASQAWVRVDVAGRSVVVQNCAGELRAFRNVCAHRQSRLCIGESGCGPLRCPYHGWSYGADGRVVGVPDRRGFSDRELVEARLIPYEVVRFGPLVFARERAGDAGGGGRLFEQELGPLYPRLERLLDACARIYDRFSLELHCNWKLLVENSIEGYHVPSVHPKTIAPLAHREVERLVCNGSSLSRFTAPADLRKQRVLERALPGRSLALDDYIHALIFPNVTVATAYGAFFVVTRTVPLAIDRCRLDVTLLETHHLQSPEGTASANAVAEMNAAFVRQTFEEDSRICAAVQAGLQDWDEPALLHEAAEGRVLCFQQRVADVSRDLNPLSP